MQELFPESAGAASFTSETMSKIVNWFGGNKDED